MKEGPNLLTPQQRIRLRKLEKQPPMTNNPKYLPWHIRLLDRVRGWLRGRGGEEA